MAMDTPVRFLDLRNVSTRKSGSFASKLITLNESNELALVPAKYSMMFFFPSRSGSALGPITAGLVCPGNVAAVHCAKVCAGVALAGAELGLVPSAFVAATI